MTATSHTLGRYERVADVGFGARRLLQRILWICTLVVAGEGALLVTTNDPGAMAFALIAGGTLMVLAVWSRFGEGLPIIPMLALQNLFIYALPIVTHNETLLRYPPGEITSAGLEVFINSVAMILSWRIAMEIIPTSSGACYALQGIDAPSGRLTRLGFALVVASTAYEVLRSSGIADNLLALLPAGTDPILHVLASAASACGFFIGGIVVGRGETNQFQVAVFWGCLAVQAFISAAGFLLSPALTVVFAAVIGLFWGNGRIPWKFLAVVLLVLGFFNVGKFVMRERYWGDSGIDEAPQVTLAEMPHSYAQWASASFDALSGTAPKPVDTFGNPERRESDQSLLQRINNLQNLLFVIDVMDNSHLQPLGGATYSLIPPLLVPRILWPNKPRTHEGQVLLNVYFGRQDLSATFETYVAWGLLPEAYGNFGPKTGAIVLGIFLGVFFAWVEKALARKLLLSVEGFLAFTVLLGMANSFEMVASVLITSLFQACVPIVLAAAPFVERVYAPRR